MKQNSTASAEMKENNTFQMNHKPLLTKREVEVLKLITDEYSSIEIADLLSISLKTVDTHRKSIIRKIGARNVVGLVKYALQLRITTWKV